MYKYQSKDGLCRSNNFSLIDSWNKIVAEREQKTKEFCNYLISNGVKALHPDDGWVDRKNNTIFFCYPKFKLDIAVGDKIALGNFEKYRIVEVVEIIPLIIYADENNKFRYKFRESSYVI